MINKFLSTAAACCFISSTALAGSSVPVSVAPVAVAAPVAAATDWSGFYFGGLVSFDSGPTTAHTISTSTDFDPDELDPATNYGVFAGYNKQMGSFVLGGELAYSTGTYVGVAYPTTVWDYMADVKARAGYSLGRAMVYGVVGYSFSDLATGPIEYNATGISYGAGVDFMITDRIFLGAEYLSRDLKGVNVANPGSDVRIDGVIQSAAIRVGMNF